MVKGVVTLAASMGESSAGAGGPAGDGGGAVTVHPDRRALVAAAEPSLTSTVQSAGAVKPGRLTLKRPPPSLVAICTPSTVIGRFAVALPSIRSLPPMMSAFEMETAAWL